MGGHLKPCAYVRSGGGSHKTLCWGRRGARKLWCRGKWGLHKTQWPLDQVPNLPDLRGVPGSGGPFLVHGQS